MNDGRVDEALSSRTPPGLLKNLRGGVSPIRPRSSPLTKSSLPGEPGERRGFGTAMQIPQCFCHVSVTGNRYLDCITETTDNRAGGWKKCKRSRDFRGCDHAHPAGGSRLSFSLIYFSSVPQPGRTPISTRLRRSRSAVAIHSWFRLSALSGPAVCTSS